MSALVVLFSVLAVGAAMALLWFSRPPPPRDARPLTPADPATLRAGSSTEVLPPRQAPRPRRPAARDANVDRAATVVTLSTDDLEELLLEADPGATLPAAPAKRPAALQHHLHQQPTPHPVAPHQVTPRPWHNRRTLGAVTAALAFAFFLGLVVGALLPDR